MIKVEIDEELTRELVIGQVKQVINSVDNELVFWDSKELCKRTCMSWSFIKDQFFYDKRFLKYKVGSKWIFPPKETKQFLELWIKEQKTS